MSKQRKCVARSAAGAKVQNDVDSQGAIRARTVTFGFRARLFAHAAPARFLANFGLVAFCIPPEWDVSIPLIKIIVSMGTLVFGLISQFVSTVLGCLGWINALILSAIKPDTVLDLMIDCMWSIVREVTAEAWRAGAALTQWAAPAILACNQWILQIDPECMRRIASAMFGVLFVFFVAYLVCSWLVYGLSSDIRSVRQRPRRWLASLPPNVADALAKLNRERHSYIVCRKACHSFSARAWGCLLNSPERIRAELTRRQSEKSWGLFNQLNFAIVIATVRHLGVKLWPYDEEKFYAEVATDRDQQKSVANDFDQLDMELRFVQDEPQRPFEGGDLSKPIYAIFQCLFNPIDDPVWVLPLANVMDRLKEVCLETKMSFEAVVKTLGTSSFPIFRRVERDPAAGVRVKAAEDLLTPILLVTKDSDGTPRYQSGYDENNISYAALPQSPDVRRALYAFQMAMDLATRKDAVRIDLEPGDLLLVRNQEAFYCRREIHDHWFSCPTVLPRMRWLRRYMAFELQTGPTPKGSHSTRYSAKALDRLTAIVNHIYPRETTSDVH
jgi:hypothetical protein